ncbi:family 10 glycosylhydrolase [Candidatus Sumerlaeota bacterium]|nr:family 10 glycosylhydrolase [Candidatus Sumerlaeota bacterium]
MRIPTALTLLLTAAALGAQTSVILVDDFETEVDWESVWLADLEAMDVTPTVVAQADVTSAELAGADAVLWNCGDETEDTLTASDRAVLNAYLDGGGNLLLVAPGAPSDLRGQGESEWMRSRLGCDYVMPDSPLTWSSIYLGHTVGGLAETLMEGVRFDLTFGPEADVAADDLCLINATDRRAENLLSFIDMPGCLGVARETPTDRTIFLTASLDSIASSGQRRDVLRRCVEWLTAPRFEGRGIWVVRTQMTDPDNIDTLVDRCADAGFNTLFVQVRGRGEAYYSSATEPRAEGLADQPETFDPLQHCLERAHAHGLQVHAWLNAGFTAEAGAPPTDPDHIVNRHPEWVMVNRSGKSLMDYTPEEFRTQYAEGRFLSLAAPEVQDYLVGVYMEVVENYDVDGIHFDYIRYCSRGVSPEWDLDYNPLVTRLYERETGVDPLALEIDSEPYEAWLEWQRDRIGEFVGRVRDEAHAARPGIRVSAAVLSRYHLARIHSLQDWIHWLQRGQIDTACLMSYSADNALVVQEALLAQENRGPGTVWVGMGARHDIDLIQDRIARVRDVVEPEGIMFFAYGGFDEAESGILRHGPFAAPARVPPVAP